MEVENMQKKRDLTGLCLCVDGDRPLLQEGIRTALRRELPSAKVMEPGEERSFKPNLLIICVSSQKRVLPILRDYKSRCPGIKTILLYDSMPVGDMLSCLSLGCCCVYKAGISAEQLIECIRMVESSFFLWDEATVNGLVAEAGKYHGFVDCLQREVKPVVPTGRELDIAKGILSGLSNEGIAKQLYLSSGTVKNNIAMILEKYNFQSRAQIISLLAL